MSSPGLYIIKNEPEQGLIAQKIIEAITITIKKLIQYCLATNKKDKEKLYIC